MTPTRGGAELAVEVKGVEALLWAKLPTLIEEIKFNRLRRRALEARVTKLEKVLIGLTKGQRVDKLTRLMLWEKLKKEKVIG